MRQKDLRIALVCYGGISLAVYMHGVTKEIWHLARASRAFHQTVGHPKGETPTGVEAVWLDLLRTIAASGGPALHIMPDIIAGASAGGINGVFLAQAIHSGQSLEPLTELWLTRADIDALIDPDARLVTGFAKVWAVPLVRALLNQPGNAVATTVAPETRAEVRAKLSRLVRSRWFEAPFGGIGFSRVIAEALDAMAASPAGAPLLPPGHPLDLFVTATDFRGHPERLRLHSPAEVHEGEHRLSIGFRARTPAAPGGQLAPIPELVLAARATASFPGAFPALQIAEIDRLAAERDDAWPGRAKFLAGLFPHLATNGTLDEQRLAATALIDGSVLVNAPFAEALAALPARPAVREVERRFIYIDPCARPLDQPIPDPRPPGWFSVIFGSLSSIPREQPIRDNLDVIERQSRERARLRVVVEGLRPQVEAEVERLFGMTLFLDHPTAKRLAQWRDKAQTAAAAYAGYAYQSYARLKISGVVDALAKLAARSSPGLSREAAREALSAHLRAGPLAETADARGRITAEAVGFLRAHDLAFRIRRLRLIARRLSSEWVALEDVSDADRQAARDVVYRALALFFDREGPIEAPPLPPLADDAALWLAAAASNRHLAEADAEAEAILADGMAAMPRPLRRLVLLAYLGFPFYDVVTLPLLRGAEADEFEPVKVDRISPEDACAIREGGAPATLRGNEFYYFGAFFSRAYRENDYLWGRLHGAERLIDIVASSAGEARLSAAQINGFRRAAFLAILAEEEQRLTADPSLISSIRAEVLARMG